MNHDQQQKMQTRRENAREREFLFYFWLVRDCESQCMRTFALKSNMNLKIVSILQNIIGYEITFSFQQTQIGSHVIGQKIDSELMI